MKKVLRVLPNDKNKQHQVIKRIGQNLGLFQKHKVERTQAHISNTVRRKIENFYNSDIISWQAPGKRDCLTI